MRPWAKKAEEKKRVEEEVVVNEEVQAEPHEEVVQEEPTQVETKASAEKAEPVVIVSDRDAHIYDRMKSQPKTIDEVEARKISVSTDGEIPNILSLPKELKPYEEKYSFCWVFKNPRSIDDYIDVLGFTMVNKALFPKLPKHLFTANGSIERGDSILMFVTKEHAEMLRRRPGEISRERIKSTLVQDLDKWKDLGDDRYYRPDSGVSENESEKEPQGRYVQPDVEQVEQT